MTQYGSASAITVQMEGPYGASGGGVTAKLVSVSLPAASWKGAASPYSQVVTIDGASVSSKVDLTPSAGQIENYRFSGFQLTTENSGGTVTVYAMGAKPVEDLELDAVLTEVVDTASEPSGIIPGNVVDFGHPQPDWNQSDSTKPDFIKNKPSSSIAKAEAALPRSGGTMTGNISMGGNKVTGLGDAEEDGDAVSLGKLNSFYAGKVIPVTASLSVSGWSGNSQRVSVSGVTTENTVTVTPAPGSWKAYGEAGVRCSAQGNGTLSFQCEETPEGALAVNILIVN